MTISDLSSIPSLDTIPGILYAVAAVIIGGYAVYQVVYLIRLLMTNENDGRETISDAEFRSWYRESYGEEYKE